MTISVSRQRHHHHAHGGFDTHSDANGSDDDLKVALSCTCTLPRVPSSDAFFGKPVSIPPAALAAMAVMCIIGAILICVGLVLNNVIDVTANGTPAGISIYNIEQTIRDDRVAFYTAIAGGNRTIIDDAMNADYGTIRVLIGMLQYSVDGKWITKPAALYETESLCRDAASSSVRIMYVASFVTAIATAVAALAATALLLRDVFRAARWINQRKGALARVGARVLGATLTIDEANDREADDAILATPAPTADRLPVVLLWLGVLCGVASFALLINLHTVYLQCGGQTTCGAMVALRNSLLPSAPSAQAFSLAFTCQWGPSVFLLGLGVAAQVLAGLLRLVFGLCGSTLGRAAEVYQLHQFESQRRKERSLVMQGSPRASSAIVVVEADPDAELLQRETVLEEYLARCDIAQECQSAAVALDYYSRRLKRTHKLWASAAFEREVMMHPVFDWTLYELEERKRLVDGEHVTFVARIAEPWREALIDYGGYSNDDALAVMMRLTVQPSAAVVSSKRLSDSASFGPLVGSVRRVGSRSRSRSRDRSVEPTWRHVDVSSDSDDGRSGGGRPAVSSWRGRDAPPPQRYASDMIYSPIRPVEIPSPPVRVAAAQRADFAFARADQPTASADFDFTPRRSAAPAAVTWSPMTVNTSSGREGKPASAGGFGVVRRRSPDARNSEHSSAGAEPARPTAGDTRRPTTASFASFLSQRPGDDAAERGATRGWLGLNHSAASTTGQRLEDSDRIARRVESNTYLHEQQARRDEARSRRDPATSSQSNNWSFMRRAVAHGGQRHRGDGGDDSSMMTESAAAGGAVGADRSWQSATTTATAHRPSPYRRTTTQFWGAEEVAKRLSMLHGSRPAPAE